MTHSPRLASLPTWLLSQAAARSHRVLHEHMVRAGATGYDYRVLAALGDAGPVSQADLGRSAALDRRDVTHTVRKLEARHLVMRQPDPSDARQTLVELTSAGKLMLERLDVVIHDVQKEVCRPLTAAQRGALLDLLRRLT